MTRLEPRPVQPEASDRRGTQRGQQQVRVLEQEVERGAVRRRLEVETTDGLTAAQCVVPSGAPRCERIAGRRLHANDLGAERGETPRRGGRGDVDGETEDPDAG